MSNVLFMRLKMSQKINAIKKAILDEIDFFEHRANQLPRKKDIDVLKKIGAIWVVSGSGSYLKPLLDVPSDKKNKLNYWYHGLDKLRINYAAKWLAAYSHILPSSPQPIMIYNGLKEQINDLFKAIDRGLLQIDKKKIYIAPGKIDRTLDQVKYFSFPPSHNKNIFMGVISNAPHLARILRFMNKNRKIFSGVKIVALPVGARDKIEGIKFKEMETRGILDYIKNGEADVKPYPYLIL